MLTAGFAPVDSESLARRLKATQSVEIAMEALSMARRQVRSRDQWEKIDVSELAELERMMHDPRTGVPLAERTHRLKKYAAAFVGSEAVTWICATLRLPTRHAAACVANRMMSELGSFVLLTGTPYFSDDERFALYRLARSDCDRKVYARMAADELLGRVEDNLTLLRGILSSHWSL